MIKTNSRHSVTDEIYISNSKNIGHKVKKDVVSAFKRKSKVVSDLPYKIFVERFLRSTKFSFLKITETFSSSDWAALKDVLEAESDSLFEIFPGAASNILCRIASHQNKMNL